MGEIKKYKSIGIVVLIAVILIAGYFILRYQGYSGSIEGDMGLSEIDKEMGVKITEEGVKYLVDPDKIISGGVPKGGIGTGFGIPALAEENIKFVSVSEADSWIEDNALVLAIVHNGIERVYPLQIMSWHEIVNDDFNGKPLMITYCPLCGSGIAYEREIEIDGKKVESRFGTSGKLYNSNLVMYDEATDTYWTQIDGKAIVGELTGQELIEISVDTVAWREWKASHPNSRVLSTDTGFSRNYESDNYANYYEDDFYLFPGIENKDLSGRIRNKDVIFGIEIDGKYKAYTEVDLIANGEIEDTVNGVNIKITRGDDGVVKIVNVDDGSEIVKERDFWFAWYAFHPDSELYRDE